MEGFRKTVSFCLGGWGAIIRATVSWVLYSGLAIFFVEARNSGVEGLDLTGKPCNGKLWSLGIFCFALPNVPSCLLDTSVSSMARLKKTMWFNLPELMGNP